MQGTPPSLSRVGLGQAIATSTPCPRCGYDLKGLGSGDRCPECATPILASVASKFLLNRGLRSSLTDASPHYLNHIAWGSTLMMLAVAMAVLTPVLLIIAGVTKMWSLLLLVIIPFATWPIGVWMFTIPRQPGLQEQIDHTQEWRRLRLWTRITQWAWPLAALAWWGITWFNAAMNAATTAITAAANAAAMGFPAPAAAPAPPPAWLQTIFFSFGWPAWIVAFAGLPLLAMYLARIADWACDTELANRLMMSAWGIVAGPLMGLLGWVVIPTFGPPSMKFIGSMFGTLGVICFILCFCQLGLAVFQCWNIARWAVNNNEESTARDQRLAARASKPNPIERMPIRLDTMTPPAMPEQIPKFAPDYNPDAPPPPPRGRVIRRTGDAQPLDIAPDGDAPAPPRRHPPRQ